MENNRKKPKDIPVTTLHLYIVKSLYGWGIEISKQASPTKEYIHYMILDTWSESSLQSSKLITLPPMR